MKLILEPADGITPLLEAIRGAEKTIEILIFRLDIQSVVVELKRAVRRGVAVHALIAHAATSGTHDLRRLEVKLLEAGLAVSRTDDRYPRYHGKMLIVDGKTLHLYGFNCTRLDVRSRSFGIVTSEAKLVSQAREMFWADAEHRPYEPSDDALIVSPDNSRQRLEEFLRGAKEELRIYDTRLNDKRIIRLLEQRMNAGVDVRIIGAVSGPSRLNVVPYAGARLHGQAMVRDGAMAFIGSQSLRKSELDERREVGLIIKEPDIIKQILDVFERDWTASYEAFRKRTA